MKKIVLTIMIAMILTVVVPLEATAVSDIQKQKKQTQKQLDELAENVDELKADRDAIATEIDSLDAQLLDILTSISICQDEINAKEEQIIVTKKNLKAAKKVEEQQYIAMTKRIRFMYEKGNTAYVQLFLGSGSFSEMLNKAEYAQEVYDYDRDLLAKYKETKDQIATSKKALEDEEGELLATNLELVTEQEVLEVTMDEMRLVASDFDAKLATAKSQVDDYKQKLKQQTDQIKALEELQARAAAKQNQKRPSQNYSDDPEDPEAGNYDDGGEGSGSGGGSGGGSSDPGDSGGGGYSGGGSGVGAQVAAFACQFVGNPYVLGGTSLTNGADCSGFTQSVYREFGYSIPRNSVGQRSCGRGVSYEEAQPGDLICYAGHVALYLGNGNIVHASSPSTGIKYGRATYRTILAVRRVV